MLSPQHPLYHIAAYLDIVGAIDAEVFEQALRQMVAKTDSLHICIVETEESLLQAIGPEPRCNLNEVEG
ncbi:hypothetical protein C2W62_14620 [Candidatus Entotheonella serta]|nr:hypothetical protein C2W62_14620 [Candidatus Entotheonella serta]